VVTVSEVVVGLRSEGAEDTKDDLEGVSDQTEETTQQLQAQSDQMTELAQSFSGALKAATVGLAVASAGLLSQVPILGQAFDGLFAIVNSIALAMDTVLRPVLAPLTNKMFELSQAINESGAPIKTLLGILAAVGAVIAGVLLGPVGVLGAAIAGLVTGAGLAAVNFDKFKKAVTRVANFIKKRAPPAIKAFVKKLNKLAGKVLTELQNRLDAVNWEQVGKKIMRRLIDATVKFAKFAKDVIDKIDWKKRGKQVARVLKKGILALTSIMKGAGEILMQKVIDGIDAKTDELQQKVNDVVGTVNVLPGVSGVQAFETTANNGGTSGTSSSGRTLPGSQTTTTQVFLNGREIGQGTSGERFDESARRGQTF